MRLPIVVIYPVLFNMIVVADPNYVINGDGLVQPTIFTSQSRMEGSAQRSKSNPVFQSSVAAVHVSQSKVEEAQAEVKPSNYEIRVGFLMPSESYFMNTAGAIRIAWDRVQKEQLLPGANWSFLWHIDECNESVAVGFLITLMKHEKIHVILEPPCYPGSLVTAVVAKRYRIPVFSWCTNDIELADSKRFPARVSTAASPHRIAEALKEFLLHVKWRRVGVFYTISPTKRQCENIVRSFNKLQQTTQISNVYESSIRTSENTDSEMANFLDNVKATTRVIILCLENDKQLEKFMFAAHQKRMTGNDYAYVILQYAELEETGHGMTERTRRIAMEPMFKRSVFIESSANEESTVSFKEEVVRKLEQWPFYYRNKNTVKTNQGLIYSPLLHDAFYLYALALNRALRKGSNLTHTEDIVHQAKNIEFQGQSGKVRIDQYGDRKQNFVLNGFDSDMNMLQLAEIDLGSLDGEKVKMIKSSSPILASYTKDIPNCVFTNEACESASAQAVNWTAIVASCTLVFALALICGIVWLSQRRLGAGDAAVSAWKIGYNEIVWINDRNRLCATLLALVGTTDENEQLEVAGNGSPRVVKCRGAIAWTKEHTSVASNWTSKLDHWHIKVMKNLSHDNLNTFFGLCVDLNHPISVWSFNSKGSLDEVIKNEAARLDMVFKCSLMKDLATGMEYICNSPLKSHGRLKSSNCLVDKRWVLKIADYGLPGFRTQTVDAAELLWTAPEFLRMKSPPASGTEKGDVYSFAIVLQELFDLNKPYWREMLSPEEIITRVRAGEDPPFRPTMNPNAADEGVWTVIKLMCECWEENPQSRPNFRRIKSAISEIRRGGTTNLMEYVLKTSERYAGGLEEVVQERMRQLAEEKKKTDQLLSRLLPKLVADSLRNGQSVEPECFECTTVLFSDVVGFTNMAARSSPLETVNLLNTLYSLFDDIIAQYDVYKVVTIGDGYMCGSGLPIKNGNRHASELGEMSLHVISAIKSFKIPHRPTERLEVRIGIHTGPVVAGIVGMTMPRYCVFGDTVNTANRLEGSGQPSCIHISDVTNEYLTKIIGGFMTEPRGEVIIKGKGVIFTYWLIGKTGKNAVSLKKPGENNRCAIMVTHDAQSEKEIGKMPLVEAD